MAKNIILKQSPLEFPRGSLPFQGIVPPPHLFYGGKMCTFSYLEYSNFFTFSKDDFAYFSNLDLAENLNNEVNHRETL